MPEYIIAAVILVHELPDLVGAIRIHFIIVIENSITGVRRWQRQVAVGVIDDLSTGLRRLMRVFGYAPISVEPALGVERITLDEITEWIIGGVRRGFSGIAKIDKGGVGDKAGPGISIFVPGEDRVGCLSCVPYVRLDVVGEPAKKIISKILPPIAIHAVRQNSDGVPFLIIGDGEHVVEGIIMFDPNGVDTAEADVGIGMIADKVIDFTAGGQRRQQKGYCQGKVSDL